MATVNQIYGIVNDSAAQALGKAAITVKDTGSLVSLGDVVLSSDENKEAFYNALTERIGKTVIAIREYSPKLRSVMKDEMDWGAVYQKISYKWKDAVENPSWETSTQADPFDVEISTEAVQKLFSKIGTYSFEDSIPDYQLFTAFENAGKMNAFIGGIYTNMANALAVAEEDLANLAVATNIAGVLRKGKATQVRNLITEYNLVAETQVDTAADALMNADFLKFAVREIKLAIGNMKKMSTLFNADGMPRFTSAEKQVVEVLGQFASAVETNMESDVYHNELVKLPAYEEVAYWQAPGTGFAFADVSKVDIKNDAFKTTTETTGEVSKANIVAFVHDADSCASIIYRRRSHSIYNPRAERFNIFEKADKGYAVDLSENAVVFVLA